MEIFVFLLFCVLFGGWMALTIMPPDDFYFGDDDDYDGLA